MLEKAFMRIPKPLLIEDGVLAMMTKQMGEMINTAKNKNKQNVRGSVQHT